MIDTNGLDQKREMFARCLVEGMSQAAAFRASHPGSRKWAPEAVYAKSSAMAAEDKVRVRVAELRAHAEAVSTLSRADVLNQLRHIILSDAGDLFDADGMPKPLHELAAGTRAALASVEIGRDGAIKYKFWDKNAALDKAMKYLGLYDVDNKQKTDGLTALLQGLSGNVQGVEGGNGA